MVARRDFCFSAVVLLLCTNGCAGLCGNRILKEETSPDSHRRAVIFERDCGATTGFSLHVSILAANESLPEEGGNAFVEDGNRGKSEFWAQARWLSQERIVITYPSQARVFLKETLVKGVGVTYDPIP